MLFPADNSRDTDETNDHGDRKDESNSGENENDVETEKLTDDCENYKIRLMKRIK